MLAGSEPLTGHHPAAEGVPDDGSSGDPHPLPAATTDTNPLVPWYYCQYGDGVIYLSVAKTHGKLLVVHTPVCLLALKHLQRTRLYEF